MKVFISYSKADEKIAASIAETLRESDFEVWTDATILPGDNWARKIAEALESCDAMVVLLSPAAMQSDRVRQEIEFAIGSPQYSNRLIPVMVKRTKPGDYPWILDRLNMISAAASKPADIGPRVLSRLMQPA